MKEAASSRGSVEEKLILFHGLQWDRQGILSEEEAQSVVES